MQKNISSGPAEMEKAKIRTAAEIESNLRKEP